MSNAITEAQSFDQVVDIMNESNQGNSSSYYGGSDTRSVEDMAGQYAWEAAEESGYIDVENISAHLNFLAEAGVEFDFNVALQNAFSRRKNLHVK